MTSGKKRGATPKKPVNETTSQKPAAETKSNKYVRPESPNNLSIWFAGHQMALTNALKRLFKSPLAALLTILVIGVALSLPAGLQVIIKNLEMSQHSIDDQTRISLYLKENVDQKKIDSFVNTLKVDANYKEVRFISSEAAWNEFQTISGITDMPDLLQRSPLPDMILVLPDPQLFDPEQIETLVTQLSQHEMVDLAKIDLLWLKRLFSIIDFVKHSAIALSVFLIFIVLIVIGNTIKMIGQNFREEILVSKLVGATDSYVRRPFLYSGILYGLLGSAFASVFVFVGISLLNPQLGDLATLYQTTINIIGLGFGDLLTLMSIGIVLGLGGAWIAANRLIGSLSI